EVEQGLVLGVGQLAPDGEPGPVQQVHRTDDDAERGDDGEDVGVGDGGGEGAEHDPELAHEAVEQGQADRRHHDPDEEGGVDRHHGGDAAVLLEIEGVAALVEDADQDEQAAGRDAVVEHLVDGALGADQAEGEDANHDEAHVADRAVGDQLLHVGLHEGDQRAVDDADQAEHDDDAGQGVGGAREEAEIEAQHAVRPHLQQDAGEQDRAGRRRLDVGVGQPGVEREQRNLDGEGDEEAEEQPGFGGGGKGEHSALEAGLDGGEVEGAGQVVEPEDAAQHQHRTRHGVQEELDGGVEAALVSPDADEEGHRNQRDFPEGVEQEQIEAAEDAEHAGLEQQQEDEKRLGVLLDGFPGDEHADQREERGQHAQPEREAVGADQVLDVEGRDPGMALEELETAFSAVPVERQMEREQERDDRGSQRDQALGARGLRQQQGEDAQQGEEDDPAQDRGVDEIHRLNVRDAPVEVEEDGRGAERHPGGVAADVARGLAAEAVAGGAGGEADAVHRAIDQARVHGTPKHDAAEGGERPGDDGAVELVHPVLVEDEVVQAAQARGQALGQLGVLEIEEPGGEQAQQRHRDRDGRDRELAAGDFVHRQRWNPGREDGIKEVLEAV